MMRSTSWRPQAPASSRQRRGAVEKLFVSEAGGNTIYVRSHDGARIYYYAHLQKHAPGLHEGMKVTRGQSLGAVGSTGNADSSAPHLHFALYRMNPGERWYEGTPVMPC